MPILAVGAPSSTAQVAFGDVLLGGMGNLDEHGVFWVWSDINGWGATKSTAQFTQRGRADGAYSSEAFRSNRTFSVMGSIIAPDAASLVTAQDKLNAAATITQSRVTVTDGGFARWVNAQRIDEVLYSRTGPTSVDFSTQWVTTDARKFSDPLTQSTQLPASSGGMAWPMTWPMMWNGSQTTGVIAMTNPGNAAGKVVLRINGPVVGPSVTHIASGRTLEFASSLTLANGEWLDIDLDAKTVLANGQASRAGWVTSRGWFGFDVGDNQFGFGAVVYNPSTSLLVTAYPAYL